MRPLLYVLTALSLIALAFWAYRENYTTQASIREVGRIQDEIAILRESLAQQKAVDQVVYPVAPDATQDPASAGAPQLSNPLDAVGRIENDKVDPL